MSFNSHPRKAEAGFTIVETAIAMGLAAVGLMAMASVIVECSVLQRHVREQTVVHSKSRDILEQLRGIDASAIPTLFGPGADPGTPGGTQTQLVRSTAAENEASLGLDVQADVAAPRLHPVSQNLMLSSSAFSWAQAFMNNNGLTTSERAALARQVTPVLIVNAWRGVSGERSEVTYSFVSKRQ